MNVTAQLVELQAQMIELLDYQLIEMQHILERERVANMRLLRDIAVQYKLGLMNPDGDHLEKIEDALRDIEDELARLEEQVI